MLAGEIQDSAAPKVFSRLTFGLMMLGAVGIPVIFWPWSSDVFVGPKSDLFRLWVVCSALSLAGWHLTAQHTIRLGASDVLVVSYLLLNGVAFALSIDHRTSLFGEPLQQVGIITIVALAVTYGVARLAMTTTRRVVLFLGTVAFAGSAVAVYGVVQLAGIDPIWSTVPNGRVFSTIGQPNWLAAYLVMTIPLTFGVIVVARRATLRVLGAAALILQITVVAATRSRSGYLGLAAVAAVGLFVLIRHIVGEGRITLAAVGLSALTCGLAVVLLAGLSRTTSEVAPSNLAGRAISMFDVDGFDALRYISLWKVGVAIAADHPLFGTGQDTYAIVFPEYRDRILDSTYARHFAAFRPESPHNAYLGVASGAGIPALLGYFGIIGCALAALMSGRRSTGRNPILAPAILAALVGHLVTDFFMTIDLSGSWLFWTLIGAALASSTRRRDAGAYRTFAERPCGMTERPGPIAP